MIRRLVRAVLAYLRRLNQPRHRGMRPTRAQRIARVALAADVRYETRDAYAVRVDMALWEGEMLGHLVMLSDGAALLNWGFAPRGGAA